MGITTTGSALKCFNGPKMWRLEWYTSNDIQINPEGQKELTTSVPWSGRLVGTHDYFNSCYDGASHRVVVKVGDLYVWFNRVEEFTSNAGGFSCLSLGGTCANDSDKKEKYENFVMVSQQNPDGSATGVDGWNQQALLPLDFHLNAGMSVYSCAFWYCI